MFSRYPILTISQENLYKMEIWLVRPTGPVLYKLFFHLVSTYQVSSSYYQKCLSYSKTKIFAIGNFLVGRVGRLKNGWIFLKRYSRMQMHERKLHTKFQLNRPKIGEVIPRFHFWKLL